MEVTGSTLPGYRVNEYLLVIQPHHDLAQRIMSVKQQFNDQYKVAGSITKPQLALASFTQYSMIEERILNRLRLVAMGITPFKVDLKNFGSFPSHTIYINVTSKIAVQGLIKEIRSQSQRLMKLNDENKPYFIMEPHF